MRLNAGCRSLHRAEVHGPGAPGTETFHGFTPLPPRGRPVTNAVVDALREDEAE